MSRLSHWPSDPVYYIEDCRISSNNSSSQERNFFLLSDADFSAILLLFFTTTSIQNGYLNILMLGLGFAKTWYPLWFNEQISKIYIQYQGGYNSAITYNYYFLTKLISLLNHQLLRHSTIALHLIFEKSSL